MKKLFAVLLALVMLFALSASAMADMQTLSWITARRGLEMTDLTGAFHQIPETNAIMWIPDMFEYQDEIPNYTYCVFATADNSASISVNSMGFDGQSPDLEEVEKDFLPDWGAKSDGIFWINGIYALVYEYEEEDSIGVLVLRDDGDGVEFEFQPASSSDMYSLTSLLMSTIQYKSLSVEDVALMIVADLNSTWDNGKDVRYADNDDAKGIDVLLWEDGITSENIHDVTNWDDIKQKLIDNFADVYGEVFSEFGMDDVTLTVKFVSANDDEDLSFLTIQDGEVVYDVFEEAFAA